MPELRPFQIEAIQALRRGGHVLCVAPTGAGKTRIFHEIARGSGMRTLLVSPLVALARQHAERAELAGLRVIAPGEMTVGRNGIRICSPESLRYPGLRSWLARWRPNFLVVDECHCIYEWGEEFRPAFRELPGLVRELGIARSLWITATMPQSARTELAAALGGELRALGGFALPPQLHLATLRVPRPERLGFLRGWIAAREGPGIVFVPTRAATQQFAAFFSSSEAGVGRHALAYHAGMSVEERLALERRVRDRDADLVVATSAFGLGMDHPHLEWAVQWQPPPSLLSLAQAMGRAGRAPGRPAQALVLWDGDDFRTLEWLLGGSLGRRRELLAVRRFLESPGCRRAELSRYFGDLNSPFICDGCNVCGTVMDRVAE